MPIVEQLRNKTNQARQAERNPQLAPLARPGGGSSAMSSGLSFTSEDAPAADPLSKEPKRHGALPPLAAADAELLRPHEDTAETRAKKDQESLARMSGAVASGQKKEKAGGVVQKVGTGLKGAGAVAGVIPGGQGAAAVLAPIGQGVSALGKGVSAAGAAQQAVGASKVAGYAAEGEYGGAHAVRDQSAARGVQHGVGAVLGALDPIGVEVPEKVEQALDAVSEMAGMGEKASQRKRLGAMSQEDRTADAAENFHLAQNQKHNRDERGMGARVWDKVTRQDRRPQAGMTDLNDPTERAAARARGFE